jgi:spartin
MAPQRTSTRLSLSAALILASLESSAVQLIEAGGAAVSAALSHKYGTTTAEENLAIVGRTALNIVLVYVDARGLGRRVVVKQMAKSWIRGRIAAARRR